MNTVRTVWKDEEKCLLERSLFCRGTWKPLDTEDYSQPESMHRLVVITLLDNLV